MAKEEPVQESEVAVDYVTVAALRALIEGVPDDVMVVLQKDAEGNGYSPLAGVERDVVYEAETTWSGNVVDPEDTDYVDPEAIPCVCLWPVN